MSLCGVELTTSEQWCSDQLYAFLTHKTRHTAFNIVRNMETLPKSKGIRAWYRIMHEAEGQLETKKMDLSEKLFDPNRKSVAAKDVVNAIEQCESELREYATLCKRDP